jgi:hypothetical protein
MTSNKSKKLSDDPVNETTSLLPTGNSAILDISPTPSLAEYINEYKIILMRTLPVILAYFLQKALPMVGLFSLGRMVKISTILFNFTLNRIF